MTSTSVFSYWPSGGVDSVERSISAHAPSGFQGAVCITPYSVLTATWVQTGDGCPKPWVYNGPARSCELPLSVVGSSVNTWPLTCWVTVYSGTTTATVDGGTVTVSDLSPVTLSGGTATITVVKTSTTKVTSTKTETAQPRSVFLTRSTPLGANPTPAAASTSAAAREQRKVIVGELALPGQGVSPRYPGLLFKRCTDSTPIQCASSICCSAADSCVGSTAQEGFCCRGDFSCVRVNLDDLEERLQSTIISSIATTYTDSATTVTSVSSVHVPSKTVGAAATLTVTSSTTVTSTKYTTTTVEAGPVSSTTVISGSSVVSGPGGATTSFNSSGTAGPTARQTTSGAAELRLSDGMRILIAAGSLAWFLAVWSSL